MPLRFVLVALLIATGVYLLHLGDYFFFDSVHAIADNQVLRTINGQFDHLRLALLSTGAGPLGRPLSNLSFALNALLAGDVSPFSIKFTNILIHGLTGVGMFLLLQLVLRSSPLLRWPQQQAALVAAMTAVVWLLHPLHVSTVLYAVQRMAQLSALFTVFGLYCYFQIRIPWMQRRPALVDFSRAVFCVFLFTSLAAFSKENGLLLPWLLLSMEMCLFRFSLAGSPCRTCAWSGYLMMVLPFLLIALMLVSGAYAVTGAYELRDFSLAERLLTQTRILWLYLYWLLLPMPSELGFFHDDIALIRSAFEPLFLLSAAGWLGLIGLAWCWRNRLPLLPLALLWFFYGHFMESGVVALELAFEHRNYLPALGPLLLVCQGICALQRRFRRRETLVFVGVLAVLGSSLFWRTSFWRSERQLAEHHYTSHPTSVRARIHLASVYRELAATAGDRDRAQQYYRAAYQLARQVYVGDRQSVAALYLLTRFDANSSQPGNARQWQKALDQVVREHPLDLADMTFLLKYVECIKLQSCRSPPGGLRPLLEFVVREYNRLPVLRHLLADYCLALGDLECARDEGEALLAAHPDYGAILSLLYEVAADSGDNGEILQGLQRLLRHDRRRRIAGRIAFEEAP